MSRSKYAFIPADPSEVGGSTLDFFEAQTMLGKHIPDEEVEEYYQDKRELALSDEKIKNLGLTQPNSLPEYVNSWKSFGELECHRKKNRKTAASGRVAVVGFCRR